MNGKNINNVNLTKEQKKKYRKQYLYQVFGFVFITIIMFLGILNTINLMLSENLVFFLVMLMIIVDFYSRYSIDTKYKIDLIKERIEKRISKNLKRGIKK